MIVMTPTDTILLPTRRTLLRGGLALLSAAALPMAIGGAPTPARAEMSDQDLADVARIEQYMDNIITMQARFQQVEPDGKLSFGYIYLRKPGRLRVEYDPPVPILLVADGGLLSYYDKDLDELKQMPLQQSSAWFLVRYPIKLTDGITVSGIARSPGGLEISLYQTDQADAGSVSLIFVDNPLHLTQWTVTDGQNKEVRVGLLDVQVGIDVPNNKFGTPRPCKQTDNCAGGASNRGGGGGGKSN
jgi:outer membrane lipoprotein-sorting protein